MSEADFRVVYYSPHTLAIKKLPDLSSDQLARHFNAPDLKVATSKEELSRLVDSMERKENTVLLWMSSGRFDGLDLETVSKSFA